MLNNEGKIIDRREMLKIKLKSLAEEARIIRREEQRTRGALRDELHHHRIQVVRKAARETHIAYAEIRGIPLERVERQGSRPYDAKAVHAMVKKYGPVPQPVVLQKAA